MTLNRSLVVGLLLGWLGIIGARPVRSQPLPMKELRGVWLTNVASPVYTSRATIAAAMDTLKALGFNAVFPAVWGDGYTFYPSPSLQRVIGRSIAPAYAGRDVLAELIAEGHRVGIEIHPWFEYGFSSSYGRGGGELLARNPEWAASTQTGSAVGDGDFYWMSVGNSEVRRFLIGLATEVVDRYDIDGVMFDRVRYPSRAFGYDDATRARYRDEHGGAEPPTDINQSEWGIWRAGLLEDFMGQLRDSLRAHNPQMLLSNAPIVYPYGYVNYLQNWPSWVEHGRVDFVAPQLYRFSLSAFSQELGAARDAVGSRTDRVFPGILLREGTYNASPLLAATFIQMSRNSPFRGQVQWFYEGVLPLADTLRAMYRQPAVPPFRSVGWRVPATIVQETDPTSRRTGSTGAGSVPGGAARTTGELLNVGDAITYSLPVAVDATYEVYGYAVARSASGISEIELTAADGSVSRVTLEAGPGRPTGWQKLADLPLLAGMPAAVRWRAVTAGAVADAVMLTINRKLSPLAGLTVVADRATRPPSAPLLLSASPNPFNPATVVRYTLPTAGAVRLQVFDGLGRRVRTLIDGVESAGAHAVAFDGAGLATGVYWVRLSAGNRSETTRLLLLR